MPNKNIRLVISDYTQDPKQSFHYNRAHEVVIKLRSLMEKGKIKKLTITVVPFERNKHHMTLGEKGGIYFYREGKSTVWCPFYVEGEDLGNLKIYFDTLEKENRRLQH